MRTYIQKWGNSLAFRIPIHLSKKLNLRAGNAVDIDEEENRIVLQKVKYDLDEMLNQITPLNCHSVEVEDTPRGGEEW